MKTKIIISATAACILSSGALVAVNVLERNAAAYYESDIEALADNEGCKGDGPGDKDGVCRTIGSFISASTHTLQKKLIVMSKYKKTLILSCVLAALFACTPREDGIIRLDLTKSLASDIPASETLTSALSDVTFTELREDLVFGHPRFFYADDKMCGISDGGSIYFIDLETGDPISTFDRSGRGPQEYTGALYISLRDSVVCVSDEDRWKAQFYTLNGEYLYTKELPEACNCPFFDTDGYAIIYPNYTGKRFELYRGEEKTNEFACESDITGNLIIFSGRIINTKDDYLFFHRLTDTLYRITYDSIEPYLFLDMGRYSHPHELRGKPESTKGYINFDFIYFAGDFAFLSFYFNGRTREVWDLTEEKLIFKASYSDDNPYPGFPVRYGDRDFEFWPKYSNGSRIYDLQQDDETTAIISVKVQNLQH